MHDRLQVVVGCKHIEAERGELREQNPHDERGSGEKSGSRADEERDEGGGEKLSERTERDSHDTDRKKPHAEKTAVPPDVSRAVIRGDERLD